LAATEYANPIAIGSERSPAILIVRRVHGAKIGERVLPGRDEKLVLITKKRGIAILGTKIVIK
jgi:hypothetical protein